MSLNNEVFRWLQTCKYGKFITVLKQINTTSWSCTELGVRHCFSASCIRNYNTESSGVQKWIYILDCLILSGASEQKRELSLFEKHSQEILSVLNLEHQFNLPKMWCPTVAFYYMTTWRKCRWFWLAWMSGEKMEAQKLNVMFCYLL